MNKDTLLNKALRLAEHIKEIESIDVAGEYKKIQIKIKANRREALYSRITKYAAFLTIPLLVTSLILGYLQIDEKSANEKYALIVATTGSVIRHELPDNSIVWLNSGSTLRYPTVFTDENRIVDLNGEAYFEVEADKQRPFFVNTTDGLSIYVYGTKFNVNAYKDDTSIETVLETGVVNVISPDKKTVVQLYPGERLLYDKLNNKMCKSQVSLYEKLAWRDGKLIFRNTSLKDVLKLLARHFNVNIEFNNLSGKEYNYRATFQHETLPQILDYLATSAKLEWRIEKVIQQADDTFTKRTIVVDIH